MTELREGVLYKLPNGGYAKVVPDPATKSFRLVGLAKREAMMEAFKSDPRSLYMTLLAVAQGLVDHWEREVRKDDECTYILNAMRQIADLVECPVLDRHLSEQSKFASYHETESML